MKLIILFFIVTFRTSWQQDSTDTLNETLDRLIKQIDLVNRIDNNKVDINLPKNSSRVIYVNQDSKRQPEKETKSNDTSFRSDNVSKVSMIDILRAFSLRDINDNDDAGNSTIPEITLTVEKNTQPRTRNINSAEEQESSLEQLKSKSGRPIELDILEDPIKTFIAETENNLYYQNPEIIIDRITYHNDKNKHEGVIEKPVDKDNINQNDYPIIAQELKSIMNELQKLNAEETASENNVLTRRSFTSYVPSVVVNRGAIQQPCANVLMSYSSLCNSMLLRKLRGYQNLLSRARDLDTSLKLNWGARDERPDALMRTSRTGELNRIHFITNRMSRFGYQPLYG